MSSVVGHALGGVFTSQLLRSELPQKEARFLSLLCTFLAVLPDLDVVLFIVFRPSGMTPHRGFSHSIAFALIAASLATVLAGPRVSLRRNRLFAGCFGAIGSHLVLDFLMGAGPRLPLFAPFSNAGFLSPISVVPWAFYSTSVRGLASVAVSAPTLFGIFLEFALFIPMIILARGGLPPKDRMLLLSITTAALCVTLRMYN